MLILRNLGGGERKRHSQLSYSKTATSVFCGVPIGLFHACPTIFGFTHIPADLSKMPYATCLRSLLRNWVISSRRGGLGQSEVWLSSPILGAAQTLWDGPQGPGLPLPPGLSRQTSKRAIVLGVQSALPPGSTPAGAPCRFP